LSKPPQLSTDNPIVAITPTPESIRYDRSGSGTSLASDPDCSAEAEPTSPTTEGPYYTADTPERTSLTEPGVVGTKLVLTGYVLDTDCTPIPGAWLDFWQADGNGQYDNTGYRLRGHQFTDDDGRYYLETVIPGLYPGRPHIHVKSKAPNQALHHAASIFPGEQATRTTRSSFRNW
jgi:protocatechuate 3,4-dioxygenase beta subunit